jgi:hypothetical protein
MPEECESRRAEDRGAGREVPARMVQLREVKRQFNTNICGWEKRIGILTMPVRFSFMERKSKKSKKI